MTDAGSKLLTTLAAVAGFIGVFLILFLLAGRVRGRLTRPAAVVVLLGPGLLLVAIGLVVPAIRTVYLSLHNASGKDFIGARNYAWAFTTPAIQHVLTNTLLWMIVVPVLSTGLGLALALLLDRVRGEAVYKAFLFMPMAISFVGASIIWRFVYDYRPPGDPQIGLLSQTATWLGWHNPPQWIITQPLNGFLLMIIMIWMQTGFAMVVLSAAVKAIPRDVIESALVDGAGGARLLLYVTIPMIRNTLVVVATTIMIITLKVFDIVRTVTGGNFGTQVLANEMYSRSFMEFDYGKGSALAVILFVGVMPLVAYNIVQLRRERAIR